MVGAFVAGAFLGGVIDFSGLLFVYAHDGPYWMYETLIGGLVMAPLIGGVTALVWASSTIPVPAAGDEAERPRSE